MSTSLNLEFNTEAIAIAQSFAEKAGLTLNAPVSISSIERDNDTLDVGWFCITKVQDVVQTTSILGTKDSEVVAYVVTAELQEFDRDTGYSSDTVEITRETSLVNALKACAHAELNWKLESIEF